MNELNQHTPTIIRQAAVADAEALSALRLEALQRLREGYYDGWINNRRY
jgi:hypothetical protein